MWELCPTGCSILYPAQPPSLLRWPVACRPLIAPFIIHRHLLPGAPGSVDFYARRWNITHSPRSSFISLRLSSSDSPALLKCELYLRTVLVNCETARSRGSTHSQSQRGSRSSSHFTGLLFRSSQNTHHRLFFIFFIHRSCSETTRPILTTFSGILKQIR